MDEHRAPALAGARQGAREIGGDECVEAVRHTLQCEGAAFLQLSDGAFEIGHVFFLLSSNQTWNVASWTRKARTFFSKAVSSSTGASSTPASQAQTSGSG